MKKVRKSDLENLIEDFYCKFIAHISKEEHYDLSYKREIVNIKSTHIVVWWHYDTNSEIETDTRSSVEKFAEEIEKVTFGNLKVTYYGIGNNTTFEIYIANAYEVIE